MIQLTMFCLYRDAFHFHAFLIESLQPSHCVSPRGTEMCKGRELGPIEITLFVMPTSESELWKHSLDLKLLITDK